MDDPCRDSGPRTQQTRGHTFHRMKRTFVSRARSRCEPHLRPSTRGFKRGCVRCWSRWAWHKDRGLLSPWCCRALCHGGLCARSEGSLLRIKVVLWMPWRALLRRRFRSPSRTTRASCRQPAQELGMLWIHSRRSQAFWLCEDGWLKLLVFAARFKTLQTSLLPLPNKP